MILGVRRLRSSGPFPSTPGFVSLHHLLAEIDADQVVLEDVVVEHVLGRLAEIDDPLAQIGGGLMPKAMFWA